MEAQKHLTPLKQGDRFEFVGFTGKAASVQVEAVFDDGSIYVSDGSRGWEIPSDALKIRGYVGLCETLKT